MRNKVFRSMLQLFAEEPGGDPAPPNPDPDGKPEVTDPETPPAPVDIRRSIINLHIT